VVLPKNSTKTDWEVELALVIGKAHFVNEADALDSGYFVCNDVSERDWRW
jgi:ureidoglycolate lyase